MEYQGYKLINKIMLVCREKAKYEESTYAYNTRKELQAYLVDPTSKKQVEAARRWATWREYGPKRRNAAGELESCNDVVHLPVEFEFDNTGFKLELFDSAGGSSHGGKLSFWNCLITKDTYSFIIGIDSDFLFDLLKDTTFINGKCQSPLIFITHKGKVGMTPKGSKIYQQCVSDVELLNDIKKTKTSKFSFGDIVSTATISECYLGTITKYYEFDLGPNKGYYDRRVDPQKCTLTKLAEPVTCHLFGSVENTKSLKAILNKYGRDFYLYPNVKSTCPKRVISDKLVMDDCTEEDFQQRLINKIYDYNAFIDYAKQHYNRFYWDASNYICLFLCNDLFGLGFSNFELSSEILEAVKAAGIKYIEE